MARTKQLTTYAEGKLTSRLTRAIPYIGTFIALGNESARRFAARAEFVAPCILVWTRFLTSGGAKNLVEVARGRDFLSDRVGSHLNEGVR